MSGEEPEDRGQSPAGSWALDGRGLGICVGCGIASKARAKAANHEWESESCLKGVPGSDV